MSPTKVKKGKGLEDPVPLRDHYTLCLNFSKNRLKNLLLAYAIIKVLEEGRRVTLIDIIDRVLQFFIYGYVMKNHKDIVEQNKDKILKTIKEFCEEKRIKMPEIKL